jgi:hypothetical protein
MAPVGNFPQKHVMSVSRGKDSAHSATADAFAYMTGDQ